MASKIVDLNLTTQIITLNINGEYSKWEAEIFRFGVGDGKEDPKYSLYRNPLKYEDIGRLRVNRWKKCYEILISDQGNFRM